LYKNFNTVLYVYKRRFLHVEISKDNRISKRREILTFEKLMFSKNLNDSITEYRIYDALFVSAKNFEQIRFYYLEL